jgi:hypothetical protein
VTTYDRRTAEDTDNCRTLQGQPDHGLHQPGGCGQDLPGSYREVGIGGHRTEQSASTGTAGACGSLLCYRLALYMQSSYREVLRCLLEGIQWLLNPTARVKVTGKSGISQARTRLGVEPLKQLHDHIVCPIATKATKGAWYRGWRVVSLDGSTLDVANEERRLRTSGGPTGEKRLSPDTLRLVGGKRCELFAANYIALPLFPPGERAAFHEAVLEEILEERAVSSRNRRNPRGVKRKMSNLPLRRRGSDLMPKIDLQTAINILTEQYLDLSQLVGPFTVAAFGFTREFATRPGGGIFAMRFRPGDV